jgi:hypothetical protein
MLALLVRDERASAYFIGLTLAHVGMHSLCMRPSLTLRNSISVTCPFPYPVDCSSATGVLLLLLFFKKKEDLFETLN